MCATANNPTCITERCGHRSLPDEDENAVKKNRGHFRRHPVRKYLFLDENSLCFCQKPRKASALLHFWLQHKKFSYLTKLRSTLK